MMAKSACGEAFATALGSAFFRIDSLVEEAPVVGLKYPGV